MGPKQNRLIFKRLKLLELGMPFAEISALTTEKQIDKAIEARAALSKAEGK